MANYTPECWRVSEYCGGQQNGGACFHVCDTAGGDGSRGGIASNGHDGNDGDDNGICLRAGEQSLGQRGRSQSFRYEEPATVKTDYVLSQV